MQTSVMHDRKRADKGALRLAAIFPMQHEHITKAARAAMHLQQKQGTFVNIPLRKYNTHYYFCKLASVAPPQA